MTQSLFGGERVPVAPPDPVGGEMVDRGPRQSPFEPTSPKKGLKLLGPFDWMVVAIIMVLVLDYVSGHKLAHSLGRLVDLLS